MKVGIIGCGYVGLINAVGLALRGHDVLGVDIDKMRVEKISQGIVPFHEPGVSEGLKVCLLGENLKVSTSMEEVGDCEVVLICVQTSPQADGSIDLKVLKSASLELASVFTKIPPKNRTVVVRSTVIPGTTEKFVTPIFRDKKELSTYTNVAFSPEFLREGSALKDFLRADRIVIGTHSPQAAAVLTKLYEPFNSPIIITTPSTAEMAKYTSNTLLSTLISFSNEIAKLCEKTPDTDVEDVLKILHLDHRFYSDSNDKTPPNILSYLKAGCGFGGSCLPKDLSALISYAHSLKEKVPLLEAVESINKNQSLRIVKLASSVLGGLKKRKVAVLGAAFKGGTDDLRESPGLKIVDELLREKAQVIIYDPLVSGEILKGYKDRGVKIASSLSSATDGADACIIATNAPEFQGLNGMLKNRHPVIIDGRRVLSIPESYSGRYMAVGRFFNF